MVNGTTNQGQIGQQLTQMAFKNEATRPSLNTQVQGPIQNQVPVQIQSQVPI